MKIGILTFHCANNYGAVLQAYGLQQYLILQGHDARLINYTPKYKLDNYKKFNPRYWLSRNPYKCVIRLIHECIVKPIRIRKWNAFDIFRKENYKYYDYIPGADYADLDAVIIGSDQVWNPSLTGGDFDTMYFGIGFNTKVIPYAASARFLSLNEYQSIFFKKHLDNFHSIGVREKQLKTLLQGLTKKEINVVLDPTLLAGSQAFDKISLSRPTNKKYVLVYEIHRNKGVYETAKRIAQHNGLYIIELVQDPMLPSEELDPTASPSKFVSYFKYADFVVTTSFHGLAFALMYNKDFYAIKQNNSADDRLQSILSLCGLEERFIPMDNEEIGTKVDFTLANQRLKEERSKSESFIKNALNY